MNRDEFSVLTRDRLAKRVGVRCSNPSCRKLTTGPRSESSHIINIGVAAHITAAASGGPRFDPSLSSEERESAENGIWLCQNCAKMIDNDPARYSTELLRRWKGDTEASTLAELEGKPTTPPTDLCAEIEISYRKKRISGERHDYCLEVTLTNRGTEPLGAYHLDLTMPAIVVSNIEIQASYVEDRSDRDTAFFRVKSTDDIEQQLYPGDSKIVMAIPYYIDDKIYQGRFWDRMLNRDNRRDLFQEPVIVTFYRYGFQPLTLERCFGEFQIF